MSFKRTLALVLALTMCLTIALPSGVAFAENEQYTVSFDANGGTGSMEGQTFTAGVEQALSKNAFVAPAANLGGTVTFYGWATVETKDLPGLDAKKVYEDGATITVNSDMTLYAVWKETTGDVGGQGGTGFAEGPDLGPDLTSTYTVTFKRGAVEKTVEVVSGQTVSAPADIVLPVYEHWFVSESGSWTMYDFNNPVTSNLTLNAMIHAYGGGTALDPLGYCIFFANNNNGTDQYTLLQLTSLDNEFPACPFTKDGYSFVEWNTQPDGSGDSADPEDEIELDVYGVYEFYAIWEEDNPTSQLELPVADVSELTIQEATYALLGQSYDSIVFHPGLSNTELLGTPIAVRLFTSDANEAQDTKDFFNGWNADFVVSFNQAVPAYDITLGSTTYHTSPIMKKASQRVCLRGL